jgi:hypothetical protein
MPHRTILTALLAGVACALSGSTYAQVVAPSTWADNITIDAIVGPPPDAAFDDWDAIPLAVSDPADNPSVLNIIDVADVKIANDNDFIYIYASGHKMRTNGLYLAFDTDQELATGFDIFGLGLVGSEIGYVNDFVFDQRTPGVFNDNKTAGAPDPGGSCCTGGPLDVNNGGAAMNPTWDVESAEREWGIPLDAVWSVNEPFGPTFPNPTFNFILWTDQGLTDVTDVITYTLATPPAGDPGDFDADEDVDGADFIAWQLGVGTEFDAGDLADWRANFGAQPPPVAAIPEPAAALLMVLGMLAVASRRSKE